MESTPTEQTPIAALTNATRDSAQLAAETLEAIDEALQAVTTITEPTAATPPAVEDSTSTSAKTPAAIQEIASPTPSVAARTQAAAPSSESSDTDAPAAVQTVETLTVDAAPAADEESVAPTQPEPSEVAGATLALSVASLDSGDTFLQTAQIGNSIVVPTRPPCSANSEFLTDLRYSVQGSDTFTRDLRRLQITGGDVVVVSWDDWRRPLENCDVSLAIYRTSSARFNPSVTQQLIAFDQCLPETDMPTCNPSANGRHGVSVRVPTDGFFQVDFITGPPSRTLGPNNGWYSGQLTKSVNRLYGARTDGTPLPIDLNLALNIAPINFDIGTSNIAADSQIELQKAVRFMNGNFDVRIEIGGHTDSDGSEEGNQALSESRAVAVRDFLTAAGIAANRMDAVGYGELRPIASNDTAEGKAANRRIEFVVKP